MATTGRKVCNDLVRRSAQVAGSVQRKRNAYPQGWDSQRYAQPLKRSSCKYLSPESQMMVTTFWSGRIRRARSSATLTFAPELIPPKTPSARASFLAISIASSSETGTISSARSCLNKDGLKPAPIPSRRCPPKGPELESALEFAGSTAMHSTLESRFLSTSETPEKEPPVPTPWIKVSTRPSRASRISSPIP